MVSTAVDTPDPRGPDDTGKTPIKAVIAGWIGSFLEYYDFFIYGTAAALVFGKVFFPTADPTTATLLSLATYGVAYVARPVGSIFMGHLGDRHGRKRVLVLTVTLMGTATFLVGCLPSYNSIGLAGADPAGRAAAAPGPGRIRGAGRRQLAEPGARARGPALPSTPASRSPAPRPDWSSPPHCGCRSAACPRASLTRGAGASRSG